MRKVYENGEWRSETKEECMEKVDIEGKKPCERCWKAALDGVYVWPIKEEFVNTLKRCKHCNRVIG